MTGTGRGWAYLGAILGGSVSVAANVAHCYIRPAGAAPGWGPQTGAVALSALWPVMVLVAVEILGRVSWPAGWRWWSLRWGGLTPVTTVAAVVSYRHLSGLLASYGEDPVVSVIGPLAIDGLMVISSAALLSMSVADARTPARSLARTPARSETCIPACIPACSETRTPARSGVDVTAGQVPDSRAVVHAETGGETEAPVRAKLRAPVHAETGGETEGETEVPVRAPARSEPRIDTRTRVLRMRARHPELTVAELAAKAGKSPSTVRRYLAELTPVQEPVPVATDADTVSA